MAIDINIRRIGGDPNIEPSSSRLRPSPLDDTLYLALDSEKGIELEYGSKKEAEASRFRFYRRVREHRAAGVGGFDGLVFTIEPRGERSSLVIRPTFMPKPKVIE